MKTDAQRAEEAIMTIARAIPLIDGMEDKSDQTQIIDALETAVNLLSAYADWDL